jgi:hypothetical protein
MDRVRRVIGVAPVWLAAVMTLAAGVPHFRCRCPDGNLKLFCLNASSEGSDCCCHGSCCTASTASESSKCATEAETNHSECCGQQDQPQTTTVPGRDCKAECAGCQRSLAPAEPAILGTTKRTAGEDVTARLVARTTETSPSACVPAFRSYPLIWQLSSIPPPTDLVIAFQHFVI